MAKENLTPEEIEAKKEKQREILAQARETAKAKREEEAKLKGAEETAEEKVDEDPVMGLDIDPNVTYEFIRLDGNENARHIPSEATVWCEETGEKRRIRLSKLEKSPYVDEQSDMAVTEPSIILRGKSLFIDGIDEYKIRYLLAHDANANKKMIDPVNFGSKGLYRLRDISAEQKAQIKREEEILEAKILIKSATLEELDTFLRSQLGKQIETDFLRTRAYALAEIIPTEFNKKFNDPINKVKATYQKLVESGTVIERDGEVILATSNEVIYRYDPKKVLRVDGDIAKFILVDSEESKTLKTILGL